jgi:hypothetical protein
VESVEDAQSQEEVCKNSMDFVLHSRWMLHPQCKGLKIHIHFLIYILLII